MHALHTDSRPEENRCELSVLIPARNEAMRIRPTLQAYIRALSARNAELIVIVNGSRDRTGNIVEEEFVPYCAFLRCIVLPEAVGKGGALIRGMMESKGRVIAYTDADGATPPGELLSLVDQLPSSGLCIGSRWLPDSDIRVPQSFTRRFTSRLCNTIVRRSFGLNLTDTQCGAKALTRDTVSTVLPELTCLQWAFDIELLHRARVHGFPIQELPIQWSDRAGSTVHLLKSAPATALTLLRLRLQTSPLHFLVTVWDTTLGAPFALQKEGLMRSVLKDFPEEGGEVDYS